LAEAERQRVVRLLVHEILVGGDSITIRHSIPMPTLTPDSNNGARPTHGPPKSNPGPCYLLHSHSQRAWDNVSKNRAGTTAAGRELHRRKALFVSRTVVWLSNSLIATTALVERRFR
jgi:hypothetical protein